MKSQTDTAAPPEKPETEEFMLRARVPKTLKRRVAKHASRVERSEGYIVRVAVAEFLDKQQPA